MNTRGAHTPWPAPCPLAGDYVNPDADAEVVVADLESVLQHIQELSQACDTYKEYQRLFDLDSIEVRVCWWWGGRGRTAVCSG